MTTERSITFAELVNIRAKRIAERTTDAYSFECYGAARWRVCVKVLLQRGLSEPETEAVLRSKWMQWASDESLRPYGFATSRDLTRWIDENITSAKLKQSVAQLMKGE